MMISILASCGISFSRACIFGLTFFILRVTPMIPTVDLKATAVNCYLSDVFFDGKLGGIAEQESFLARVLFALNVCSGCAP